MPCAWTSIRASSRARSIGIDELAAALATSNVNRPTGTLYGTDRTMTVKTERPAGRRRRLPAAHDCVPRRAARPPGGSRERLRRRRERQDGELGQRRAQHLPGRAAPARDEHRRDRRRHQGGAAAAAGAAAGVRGAGDPQRPVARDSRVGARHQVHAGADRRAGHPGDLPVPAQHSGDDHPQPRAAGVDRRHVRGDVPAGLQPRQPVADGADAVGRVRRGRCDRHAREHRAPHGARRGRR